MSEIDTFKHECIGLVTGDKSFRDIPLYRLDEDAAVWGAKRGDLLLGGGSGETAALRISIPEAIYYFTQDSWNDFKSDDDLYHAYWNANQAYVLCGGFRKLGWPPKESIETWLVEHVLAFIVREFPDAYRHYCGTQPLERDGSICRKN